MSQEPSTETGGLGERRRRREAERAAAAQAEREGRPLTRKEIRRRQLEEEARRQAIATGELQLRDEQGNLLSSDQAVSRAAGSTDTTPVRRRERRDGSAPADGPALAGPARAHATAVQDAPVPSGPAAPAPSPEPAFAGAPARQAGLERPGRRPVVRAPHAAKGMRSLDATGTLTGIQPVPAAAPLSALPAPDSATDPADWASAVNLPVIDAHTITLPAAAPAPEPEPAAEPELVSTMAMPTPVWDDEDDAADGAEPQAEDDPARDLDDEEPSRPQWTTLAEYSAATGASPDEAGDTASRRALREARRPLRERVETARTVADASARSPEDAWDDEDDLDEEERENPATSVVKIVILLVAAIIIGLLIGLLAFGGDGQSGAGAQALDGMLAVVRARLLA